MDLYDAVKLASKQRSRARAPRTRATRPQYCDVRGARERGVRRRGQGRRHGAGRGPALPAVGARRQPRRICCPGCRRASAPPRARSSTVPRGHGRAAGDPAETSPSQRRSATRARSSSCSRTTSRCRGNEITNPQQSTDPNSGEPDVTFGFSGKGKSEFQNVTAQIAQRGELVSGLGQTLNQHFAVALDNQLITVPFIDFKQYPDGINGDNGADISGSFTISSAQDLANELRLGALPIKPEADLRVTGVGDARQAGAASRPDRRPGRLARRGDLPGRLLPGARGDRDVSAS